MTATKGYAAKPTPIIFEHVDGEKAASAYIEFGGWCTKTRKLGSIRVADLATMPGAAVISWVLDSLTAAVEAGVMDDETYLQKLFSSREDLDAFVHALREESDILWVNDRHFRALEALTGYGDEHLLTYAAIADALELEAVDCDL